MNIRSERHKFIVSNEDEVIVIHNKYQRNIKIGDKWNKNKSLLAFRNCFGKIYFYNNGDICFLQEDKYDKYKVFPVDKKLINKVDNLYKEIANMMKKPINLYDLTDIIIEYNRRNKIIKQMQKGIRRTIKLYYRCTKEEK